MEYIDNQHSQDLSAPNGKIILKQFNNPRSTLEAVVIAVIFIIDLISLTK